jgi:hypothetical protein
MNQIDVAGDELHQAVDVFGRHLAENKLSAYHLITSANGGNLLTASTFCSK